MGQRYSHVSWLDDSIEQNFPILNHVQSVCTRVHKGLTTYQYAYHVSLFAGLLGLKTMPHRLKLQTPKR